MTKKAPYETRMVRTPESLVGDFCLATAAYRKAIVAGLSDDEAKQIAWEAMNSEASRLKKADEASKKFQHSLEYLVRHYKSKQKNTRDWTQANRLLDELVMLLVTK